MDFRVTLVPGVAAAAFTLAAGAAALAQPATPTRGGTAHLLVQPEPPTLFLGINGQSPTMNVSAGNIYEGLLRFDRELAPQPLLARAWSISEDGLTYTFDLQENVVWHDGEPFDANDVVFSFTEFLPETHSRARLMLERAETIRALDADTVEIVLEQPFPPFLIGLETSSAPIVPEHVYRGTDYRTNPANDRLIGTGPFRLVAWRRGEHVHLERNPDYWDPELPYLDAVYYHVVPDASSRVLAFENGDIDRLQQNDMPYNVIPRLAEVEDVEWSTAGYEYFSPLTMIILNVRVPPFDDRRFRQALYFAIDREFVRDAIYHGVPTIATGPISSTMSFYEPDVPRYPYDPAKAEALLDEMGLVRGEDGMRVTIEMMPQAYNETLQRLAEFVRQSLEAVGIGVTMVPVDNAGWAQRLSDWDFQLTFNSLYNNGDPALGVARAYICDNIVEGTPFANNGGYCREEVDALFAQAAVALDPAERARLYSEVQKILVEDAPILWMMEMNFPTVYRTRLHNLFPTGHVLSSGPREAWLDPR